MKPAYRDSKLLFDENNNFIGINLGWDYTAEHEWGIEELEEDFGITGLDANGNQMYGVERHLITKMCDDYFFSDTQLNNVEYSVLGYRRFMRDTELYNKSGTLKSKTFKLYEFPLHMFESTDVASLWNSRSFAICVKRENRPYLKELYEAMLTKNVSILVLPRTNPYGGTGLCVVIASRMLNTSMGKDLYDKDKETEKLYYEVKATHIEEILKKANKKYYALSPSYDENGNLRFWLNPKEQSIYSMGWYSLEDLMAWANETGPVIKRKE